MKGNSTDDNEYFLSEMTSSVCNEKTGNIKSEVSGMFTAMFDSMTKVVNDYLTSEYSICIYDLIKCCVCCKYVLYWCQVFKY